MKSDRQLPFRELPNGRGSYCLRWKTDCGGKIEIISTRPMTHEDLVEAVETALRVTKPKEQKHTEGGTHDPRRA